MTAGLSRIHLGYVPENKRGVDECISFKREMNRRIGRVDGAYLITTTNEDRRGIEVVYDADEPGAREWAELARDESAAVWNVAKQVVRKDRGVSC